jgi:hypothetical protein
MSSEQLASQLDQLTALAITALETAAGGGGACAFAKVGIPVPGIKYAEGQWAALHEVAQLARSAGVGLAEAAAVTRTSWVDALKQFTARNRGPDWLAYRNGGVDALTELLNSADGSR